MDYRAFYQDITGEMIPLNFDVHHLDLDRSNNDISNLVAIPKPIHEKYHTLLNATSLAVSDLSFEEAIPKFSGKGGEGFFAYRVQRLQDYLAVYLEVQEWIIYREFLLGNIKRNPTSKSYENPIENLKGNNKVFNNKHKNKINSASTFDAFWDLYGKKVDTKKCKDKFCKLPEQTQQKILQVVELYVKKTPDLKFRKLPLTWLNGECWNDDYSDVKPSQPKNAKPEPSHFYTQAEYDKAIREWEATNNTSPLHDIQGHLL